MNPPLKPSPLLSKDDLIRFHYMITEPICSIERQLELPILQQDNEEARKMKSELEQVHERLSYIARNEEAVRCLIQRQTRSLKDAPCGSSPACGLPTELLCRIFFFATSTVTDNVLGVDGTWESTTVALSAVCRRWREIVVTAPSMWSQFALDVRFHDRILPIVKIFLERSNISPISFYLTSPIESNSEFKLDVFHLILAEQSRWRHFNIDTDHRLIVEMLEQSRLNFTSWPVLESVSLQESVIETFTSFTPLSDAHQLQSITLRFEDSDLPLDPWLNVLPPMQRFRDITFEGALLDAMITRIMTAAATSLESFTYRGIPYSGINYDPSQFTRPTYGRTIGRLEHCVTFPRLVSITIDVAVENWDSKPSYDILMDFFTVVTAPTLDDLTIFAHTPHPNNDLNTPYWPKDVIHTFAEKSGKHLTKLAVKDVPVDDKDLLGFLELLPTLEELTVHDHRVWRKVLKPNLVNDNFLSRKDYGHRTITKSFLQHLQIYSPLPERPLLPRLHTIRLKVRHGLHFDAEAEFVKMVQSRVVNDHLGVTKLRVVELSGWELVKGDWDVYQPLKELEKRGLMVSVISEWFPLNNRLYIV